MIKLLDQTSDINGQQLYRLMKLYPLPPFVKRAGSSDIYGTEDLHTHQFADVVYRQFPCHTSAATYISTLFFMDKKAEMDPEYAAKIEGRLDDFAFYHGISERINALKEKVASSPKDTVVNDEDFALIIKTDEGTTERHYPIRNGLEIKKAAEYLQKYSSELPFKYRNTIANKLLAKSEELGVGLGDLEEFIEKQAGRGGCASRDVVGLLKNRVSLLKRANKSEFAGKVENIITSIQNNPLTVHDNDALVKLASLIDDLDTETGLKRYIVDLTKPEDVFFSITEKQASALRNEHFATTSGNLYKINDIGNLKLNDVKEMMGEDFADAISAGGLFVSAEKFAEIASTLPRGDSELLDTLLNSVGIHPIAKEAAHKAARLSFTDLKNLGKAYQA